jgi:hypothetical protein
MIIRGDRFSGGTLQALTILARISSIMDVERSCSGRFAQDQARRIELELTQPKPATRNGRRCSVVLLGIGDTGKSQFIRHLTNTVVDTPTVKTTEIREWEVDIPFNENRPGDNQAAHQQHVTCYVTDYVGQNLGSLVEYFMIEQKTRLSKMAYGHINVLCLLVDLAKGDPLKAKKNAVPNPLRIQEQIDEWNGHTLAALCYFGPLYYCDYFRTISAEKKIKGWRRNKKLSLVLNYNPKLEDLL